MLLLSQLTALSLLTSLVTAAQFPFGFNKDSLSSSNKLSSESSKNFISSDTFTTLSHPDFASHSVRIKETTGKWCDASSVRSYTGYIDAGARHIFFYYFDSRRDPAQDDLTLWTNGGPGCSSSMGLLMELGPCRVGKDGNSTERNPYSWTETSNMIFIDQPIGVGFSYSDSGVFVGTTEDAAIDIHAFLTIFMDTFTEFQGRNFHLSGESYGGRYLPVFASEIVYQNTLLKKKKNSTRQPINLKSVLIGNGLSDSVSMTTSYYDQACTSTSGLGRPVLDVKTCIIMQQEMHRCEKWLKKVCRTNVEQPQCDIAINYCSEQFTTSFILGEINPYDISKPCTTLGTDLCYPETSVIKTYLDHSWVREMLGVDSKVGKFQSCNNKVGAAFGNSRDALYPTFFHLTALLENDIKILIYVGKYDWICNWIGNLQMVNALEWSGQAGFSNAVTKDWKATNGLATGEKSGQIKKFGGLTYLTVDNAGHMVPLDKPQEALYMYQSWLEGKDI